MRRWLMGGVTTGAVALGLLLGSLEAGGPALLAAQPLTGPSAQAGGSLEELATRLLSPGYTGPGGETSPIQLLPGQVAGGLPPGIQNPPNARVIGSAVRAGSIYGSGKSVDVIYDAPGSVTSLVNFYQQSLTGAGWTTPTGYTGSGQGGFQPTTTTAYRYYCHTATGSSLSLTIYGRRNAPNDVRLNVMVSNSSQQPGPCGSKEISAAYPGANNVLPEITLPENINVFLNNGGAYYPATASGGAVTPTVVDTTQTSDATAETSLSAAELLKLVEPQLYKAGWTRKDGKSDGSLVWASYNLPNQKDGSGFLYITDAPGQNRRTLFLRAEFPAPPGTLPYGAPGSQPVPVPAPSPVPPASNLPAAPQGVPAIPQPPSAPAPQTR